MSKIGLDAGHGLNTAGKRTPDGIREWTLNDKVRDKVLAILKDYDVSVINTDGNEGSKDESLSSRINMYLKAKVNAFVSIHHNAYTGNWNGATGVEVFVDKNCTAKDMELAKCIYDRLVKYTGLRGRGIKKENFAVINQNSIPAVLVEGGFMDGTNDYKVITSESGQNAYAKAVAEGLIDFLNLKKKSASKPSTPASSSSAKVGDTVSVKKGATYYTGVEIPQWVINDKWVVSSVKGDRAVIDKSSNGKESINSPINVKYLTVVKSTSGGTSTSKPFTVKVSITNLNIRKGPGTNYDKTGACTGKGVFTITEVKSGKGSEEGWGKLKSGAGWISLGFAKRV